MHRRRLIVAIALHQAEWTLMPWMQTCNCDCGLWTFSWLFIRVVSAFVKVGDV